jgi:putative oxidoreductase
VRQSSVAALLARILGSAIFILSGWAKVMAGAGVAGSMAKHGLPYPMLAAIVADIVELGGGVLLLVGLFTRPAAVVLAVWCVATALVAHADWSNPANKVNFMKNMAMTGGYIAIATLGAGELSLDAMLRRRRVVVRA